MHATTDKHNLWVSRTRATTTCSNTTPPENHTGNPGGQRCPPIRAPAPPVRTPRSVPSRSVLPRSALASGRAGSQSRRGSQDWLTCASSAVHEPDGPGAATAAGWGDCCPVSPIPTRLYTTAATPTAMQAAKNAMTTARPRVVRYHPEPDEGTARVRDAEAGTRLPAGSVPRGVPAIGPPDVGRSSVGTTKLAISAAAVPAGTAAGLPHRSMRTRLGPAGR